MTPALGCPPGEKLIDRRGNCKLFSPGPPRCSAPPRALAKTGSRTSTAVALTPCHLHPGCLQQCSQLCSAHQLNHDVICSKLRRWSRLTRHRRRFGGRRWTWLHDAGLVPPVKLIFRSAASTHHSAAASSPRSVMSRLIHKFPRVRLSPCALASRPGTWALPPSPFQSA